MLRAILGGLCLVAVVGFVPAAETKAEKTNVTGKFKSFKDGALTIAVMPLKKGDESKDATFKVGDDLKCTLWSGADKKDGVSAKDALKEAKTPGS